MSGTNVDSAAIKEGWGVGGGEGASAEPLNKTGLPTCPIPDYHHLHPAMAVWSTFLESCTHTSQNSISLSQSIKVYPGKYV
jgi:hypothetical protein